VRIGNNTSSTIILNTGDPQGCSISPLLYSLYIYVCVAKFLSNSIFKFADDTTRVGRISYNDETEYRNERENLVNWCSDNNLSLNVNKTKEVVIFRKRSGESVLVSINGDEVEVVNSF